MLILFVRSQVLGFNPRHRKGFLNSVMRFGMPPANAYHVRWKPRELKSIPENAFKLVNHIPACAVMLEIITVGGGETPLIRALSQLHKIIYIYVSLIEFFLSIIQGQPVFIPYVQCVCEQNIP